MQVNQALNQYCWFKRVFNGRNWRRISPFYSSCLSSSSFPSCLSSFSCPSCLFHFSSSSSSSSCHRRCLRRRMRSWTPEDGGQEVKYCTFRVHVFLMYSVWMFNKERDFIFRVYLFLMLLLLLLLLLLLSSSHHRCQKKMRSYLMKMKKNPLGNESRAVIQLVFSHASVNLHKPIWKAIYHFYIHVRSLGRWRYKLITYIKASQ